MLQNLLQINVLTLDRYFPGLNAVATGSQGVAEAIASVEAD